MFELRVTANSTPWLVDACNKVLEKGWPPSCIGVDFKIGRSDNPKMIIVRAKHKKDLLEMIRKMKAHLKTSITDARKKDKETLAEQLGIALKEAGSLEVVKSSPIGEGVVR